MKIVNKDKLDAWLFRHANTLRHKCIGIKGDTPDGRINVAWKDTVTGEGIKVKYE